MSRQPTLNDDVDDDPYLASPKTEQMHSHVSVEQRRQKLSKSANIDMVSFDEGNLLLE